MIIKSIVGMYATFVDKSYIILLMILFFMLTNQDISIYAQNYFSIVTSEIGLNYLDSIEYNTNMGTGTVKGVIYYTGMICPPTSKPGPPCDGPVPHVKVSAISSDGKNFVQNTSSDSFGKYELSLPAGDYSLSVKLLENTMNQSVSIAEGEEKNVDFVFDTGVR
jgi:hypothetical protein